MMKRCSYGFRYWPQLLHEDKLLMTIQIKNFTNTKPGNFIIYLYDNIRLININTLQSVYLPWCLFEQQVLQVRHSQVAVYWLQGPVSPSACGLIDRLIHQVVHPSLSSLTENKKDVDKHWVTSECCFLWLLQTLHFYAASMFLFHWTSCNHKELSQMLSNS